MFGYAAWNIWLNRNNLVFQSQQATLDFSVKNAYTQSLNFISFGPPYFKIRAPNLLSFVAWTPLPHGWIKLNTDGSYISPVAGPSLGGAASVLRNENSEWVAGSSRKLRGVWVIASELWAIHDGLQLAWDMDFRHLILESDAKVVITMLRNALVSNVLTP